MDYCPHCMRPVTGTVCTVCGKDVNCQNPSHLLPVGTVLAGSSEGHSYRLGVPLGQGGFGVTYIGVEQETGRRVAVKEYFPTRNACRGAGGVVDPLPGQEETYETGRFSFLKETHMLASLEGMPSVVQALDYLETNNTAYLVMEFLDGTPLFRIVQERGKIPPEDLLPRFQPLMRDIGALHAKNVIHRDISPDNVMWMTDGTFKLLDFGCARSTESNSSMTIALKQGFAPVEQYQSKGQGPYTDVYALAATMYYCLTGIIPPAAVERQLGGAFLQSPTSLGVALTTDQENALLWAMTVDPKARPANMDAFSRRMFPPVQAQPTTGGGIPPTGPATGGGFIPPTGPATGGGAVPPTGPATGGGFIPPTGPAATGGGVGTAAAEQPGTSAQTSGAAASAPKPGIPKWIPAAAVAAVVVIGAAAFALGGLLNGGQSEAEVTPPPALPSQEEPSSPPANASTSLPEPDVSPEPTAETKTSEDGFVYELRDDYVVITGYTDSTKSVVSIPDELDGYDVTRIAGRAFQGMDQIESVYLPIYLEEIGVYAFDGCTNLRDLYLYSNVKTDSSSFRNCEQLRCVVGSGSSALNGTRLPDQCITLDYGMDTGAGTLRYVWVMDDAAVYAVTTESVAVLMDVPSDLTNLVIPASIGSTSTAWIYSGALDHADSLSYVDLPDDIAFAPELWTTLSSVNTSVNDGSFAQSWFATCILSDYLSADRQFALLPTVELTRASITRAQELAQLYDHDRPDGTRWTSAVPSDYPATTGTEFIRYLQPDADGSAILHAFDGISTETSEGVPYTDSGFGIYYSSDQIYMTLILTVDE